MVAAMNAAPREEIIERFEAQDQAGNVYTVIGRAVLTESVGLDGVRRRRHGRPNYVLADGTPLDQMDAETFKVFGSNEVIRKIG